MRPETEFRTLAVTVAEPVNRTTAGVSLGGGDILDLGSVDTTDEARDTPVRVLWWRVTDMKGASAISNIRLWISGTDDYTGTNAWYLDISDAWTQGRTAVQVKTGSPGTAPLSEPSEANLTAMDGGLITGTGHGDTSRYIYVTGAIGVNEAVGDKAGPSLHVKFDYA